MANTNKKTPDNNKKKGFIRDTHKSFLVKKSDYSWGGQYDMPGIRKQDIKAEEIQKLVLFSKAVKMNKKELRESWVHFYEDDYEFERIWNNPKQYLNMLKKAAGVISPDFSLYRNMPLAMQIWNTYRNRAIGSYLQQNGIKVIPNISFGDEKTYSFCCDGAEPGGIISIGSHGTLKNKEDKEYFIKGMEFSLLELKPKTLIIYGSANKQMSDIINRYSIKYILFESDFAKSRK